jgi:hypothetical protein
MLISSRPSGSNSFWLAWIAWMLIVLGIHALTLSISPPVWQDEVQIIDFGRAAIDPGTDWSVSWNAGTSSAVVMPFYLGSLIQNVVFSLSNYNIVFPRLLSAFGAIAASTSCLLFLLSLGHDRLRSGVLSSIFLLDPIFVAGYRGDRVDCWVMAAAFLSCTALQKSSNWSVPGKKSVLSLPLLLAAGAISAIGFSIWFSFTLLAPLVIWQIINVVMEGEPGKLLSNIPDLIRAGLIWLIGFALCFFFIQAPILIGQPSAYRDLLEATSRVATSQSAVSTIKSFLIPFSRNPLLLLLAGVSIFLRPRLDFLFFAAIALAGILKSSVYYHRVVYILPYLVVHCSFSLQRYLHVDASGVALLWVRRGVLSILWTALVASITVSLVLRPVNAFASREVRQLSLLDSVALKAVGKQEASVLVEPWEFYVPGRKLGWKMYKPYFQDLSTAQILKMDYIVTTPSSALLARLPAHGFSRVGDIWLDRSAGDKRISAPRAPGYGPYLIFRNVMK